MRPGPGPSDRQLGPLIIGEVPEVSYEQRDTEVALSFLDDVIDRATVLPGTTPAPASDPAGLGALAAEVASYHWYHTIELPHGIVTPGAYDHRPLLPRYGIPADLEGKRVLDVASSDGFWAFEFEGRGAKVMAIDLDTTDGLDFPARAAEVARQRGLRHPIGDGFALAHRALGSSVERVVGTVYDLDPDRIGRFDLVHSGDLLCHLRDPCRALEQIRSVTTGEALLSEVFDPELGSGLVRYSGGWDMVGWWTPALDTLVQMVVDAGFPSVEVVTVYCLLHLGATKGPWRAVLRARIADQGESSAAAAAS